MSAPGALRHRAFACASLRTDLVVLKAKWGLELPYSRTRTRQHLVALNARVDKIVHGILHGSGHSAVGKPQTSDALIASKVHGVLLRPDLLRGLNV